MLLDPQMTISYGSGVAEQFNRLCRITMGCVGKESAFGCKMHVNANDILPKSAKDNLIYRLDNACAVKDGDTEGLISEKAAVKEYIHSFVECLLSGKSTTVTYHEIGKDQYNKRAIMGQAHELNVFYRCFMFWSQNKRRAMRDTRKS